MTAISPKDLRQFVIRPTLQTINLEGLAAEELLLGTVLQESSGGRFLEQRGGPAKGIWQMESVTHDDLVVRFLTSHPILNFNVSKLIIPGLSRFDQLDGNLYYACAMARVKYYSSPDPLPPAGDIDAQALFYVRIYNAGGKATVDQYKENWKAAL